MKLFLLVFSFLFTVSLNAQYDWTEGTIYLQNGKVYQGKLKLPMHSAGLEIGNNKVKFRKDKDSKKEKFKEEDIQKIILVNWEGDEMEFRLMPLNKNKKSLFHIIVDDETKLYARKVVVNRGGWVGGTPSTTVGTPSGSVTVPGTPSVFMMSVSNYNQLMVLKPGDKEPENLFPTGLGSFKKKAMKFFSDCPELTQKIEDKIYQKNDIRQIVIEYNECK